MLGPTWRVTADNPATVPQVAPGSIILESAHGGRFQTAQGPWLSADGTRAYIGHTGGHNDALKLEVCDLVTGKSRGVLALPVSHSIDDVSPSGRWVAVTGRGDHSVAVVSIEDRHSPDVVMRLRIPNAGITDRSAPVAWSAFIDDEHLLTFAAPRLILWRWREATAVYVVEPGPGATPRLDHNRRHVTWSCDTQIIVLDALSGGVKGVIAQAMPGTTARVSPDGSRVAVGDAGNLAVLHGPDGRRIAQIACPNRAGSEFWWLDGRFVLTRQGHLLDTDTGMVAWRFTHGTDASLAGGLVVAGKTLVMLPDRSALGERASLNVIALQWDDALAALAKLDPQEVFAVRPDIAVNLFVNIPEDPDAARRIAASLTQRLADHGVTVAQDQPVTLVATWQRDRPRTGDYAFGHGPFAQTLSATVARQHLRLAFEHDGKPLWSRTSIVGTPGYIQLRSGQTPQQALDDLARPQYTFLEQCPLPPLVPHARYANGLGSTALAP